MLRTGMSSRLGIKMRSAFSLLSLALAWRAAAAAPINDNFADRLPISGTSISVTGTVAGATSEPGEPPLGQGATVWWTWTAPVDGTYRIRVTSFGFGLVLGLYEGASLGLLSPQNEPSSSSLFDAKAGTVYQIAVDRLRSEERRVGKEC